VFYLAGEGIEKSLTGLWQTGSFRGEPGLSD
jgi:hypothetical protein